MRFSVCFHPNRHKEQNSPHRRGRLVLSAPLVCLTACQGDPTRGPGLNESLLWAWEQATKARSGAVSWGKPSFFHPEMRQTWLRRSFWNVFRPFIIAETLFPLTGQVSAVYFDTKLEIFWRKEHARSLSPSRRWRLNTKPGKPSHVCGGLALRHVCVEITWMDLVSPVCHKPSLKSKYTIQLCTSSLSASRTAFCVSRNICSDFGHRLRRWAWIERAQ